MMGGGGGSHATEGERKKRETPTVQRKNLQRGPIREDLFVTLAGRPKTPKTSQWPRQGPL
eukprot:8253840-Pyramimonas_sp.AAC.1